MVLPRASRAGLLLVAGLAAAGCDGPAVEVAAPLDEAAWRAELDEHRREREERLRAEDGWLTLIALHWLEPGRTTVGSAEGADLVLPPGSVPLEAGAFVYENGTVRYEPAPEIAFRVDERLGQGPVVLADDAAENGPDTLELGRLSIHPVARDGRHALRIKDPEAPTRTGFAGLEFYPPQPGWRVPARLERFDEPRQVTIQTVVETSESMLAPGELRFVVAGREMTLLPLVEDPAQTELWLIFRDETSGRETYPAGRYLYATLEPDGSTVIDFNRAYNPPCAFTAFATCPLPPPGNRLPAAVEAGERWVAHPEGSAGPHG